MGPGGASAACQRWSTPNSRRSGTEPCPCRFSRRSRTGRRSSLAQDGTFGIRRRRWSLSAGALAVPAPWPAAGPTLAFLQLLLGPANAAFSGHLLLGILDPADELVSGQRRDVLPSIERRRVGDQRLAQVFGKLVHHPTGHSLAAHTATVAVQGPGLFANSAAPIADARRGPLFESEGLDDGEVASEMPRVMERRRAVLASSCATAWPRVWTCPGMAAAVTAASRRRRRSPRYRRSG